MIDPIWPAPAQVRAVITQTVFTPSEPGFSQPPYGSFNLANHVGEGLEVVMANRRLLSQRLDLGPVQWLEQVHGVDVFKAEHSVLTPAPVADAIYTATPLLPIAVLTADCLPVLLCSRAGNEIAVAHAGWRGLAQGVLAETVKAFNSPPEQLLAYLGPAIGPKHFEVGEDVRQIFTTAFASYGDIRSSFVPSTRSGYYLANLYSLARLQLHALGVQAIYGGGASTFSDQQFYSYRRSGGQCGRMASLIWLS